ncbi:hypothetical protein AAFF_G00092690 [Aldrovandia affinis]|uniref:Uncharacterized protein n=1 Tax=Aldrovandia affinis TaxID=143900 RepID=A0AAD7T2Q4_9TELE|nr:hypothetical protein AAFF_G00092690 [Aldrovandia affinis]
MAFIPAHNGSLTGLTRTAGEKPASSLSPDQRPLLSHAVAPAPYRTLHRSFQIRTATGVKVPVKGIRAYRYEVINAGGASGDSPCGPEHLSALGAPFKACEDRSRNRRRGMTHSGELKARFKE